MISQSTSLVVLFAVTWILYVIYRVIWRLFLSPIARFPGPKLAALTQLYEGYYDIVKGGQYVFKIGELHKKYGPIIRINPWEIHVNDPEFYEEIYAGPGHKRERYSFFTNALEPNAAFTTIGHDLHRQRRAPLSMFFSKASIKALEPFLQERVDKLVEVLQIKQKEEIPVTISSAFTCLTNDIVCEYCFAKTSSHVENAADRDFKNEFQESMEGMMANIHLAKWIPWMLKLLQRLPDKVVLSLNPGMLSMITFRKEMENHVNAIINNQNTNHKVVSHRTIFHEILASGLPPREKELSRLWPEGSIIVGAGTDTTAWTMSVLTYHVLSNENIRERLLEELGTEFVAKNGRPRLQDLEQLPYLSAVISESLRMSFGLASHAQRVAPDEVMRYKDWVIPPGTPTSMTSVLLLTNPKTFPDPHTFNPSRWLEPPPAHLKHPLSYYLISFSRGTRQCLGMNLAYAELYLCTSYLIMGFPAMQLHDTCADDVRIWADCFMPKSSGKGVKVNL